MKNPLSITVCAFLCLASLAFCAGEVEQQETVTFPSTGEYPMIVVDDLGKSVTIEHKPHRIISSTLMTDEIILALVEKRRLIGVTVFSEDPAVSNVAPFVFDIPNRLTLNVELFISLEPDLVFVADWSDADSVEQLRLAGLPVFAVKTPVTIAGIEEKIARIGRVVGEQAKTEELLAWMRSRLEAVSEKVAGLAREQRRNVMDFGVWGDAMGSGSSWDEIVGRAGLVNAVGDITADQWGRVPISKEKLIEIDPDILVLPGWVYDDPSGADAFFTQIVSDPALADLKAIQNKSVYRMPENHKSATSQYIVFGVEDLARFAYPDLFRE